jgi:hypothetical protein
MVENRWALFFIYLGIMLGMRLIFFRDASVSITEHIITSCLSAGLMAYLDKYFKRLLTYLIKKILPAITRTKSNDN